jgi:predicted alpha/beta-hydrolase family hydrolase
MAEVASASVVGIETPHGLARAHLHSAADPTAAMILGHGAGGGIGARDLIAATHAALERNVSVALIEQPYVVAERRSPAPARQLDAAWIAVIEELQQHHYEGLPLITGGRSAGARVACRTASATATTALLCLAFPLHPPGRPEKSRLDELNLVKVPTLVVQGASDPFGMPSPGPNREVVQVKGDHSLRADLDAVAAAIRDWLPKVT